MKAPVRARSRSRKIAADVSPRNSGARNDDRQIEFEYVPTTSLKPPALAVKKQSQRGRVALRASVSEFGIVRPILVNHDNTIVSGYAIWQTAQDLDIETVPIVRASHLTQAQIVAYSIADNQIANLNPWDDDVLCTALGKLNDLDLAGKLEFSIELTGFQSKEIDLRLEPGDGETKGDSVPDVEPIAITRPGDIWALGEHRLLCGNALEAESYAALMLEERAQMVWADAPYNVRIAGNVSGLGKKKHREFAMASGEMSKAEFTAFLSTVFCHPANFSVDGSIHYQCMDWRHIREMQDAGESAYSELKNLCIWGKSNAGMGTFYRSQFEMIFVWKNGTAPHINNFGLGETGRHRSNLWSYPGASSFGSNRAKDLAMHSTVKNLSMVADAIRDCSHLGALILDPFGGSGTTLIAAQKTGRRARLIEIDPLYCDVTVRRWQALTGERAVHAESGETFDHRAMLIEADEEAQGSD